MEKIFANDATKGLMSKIYKQVLQLNINQDHNEISPHTNQNGHHQKKNFLS